MNPNSKRMKDLKAVGEWVIILVLIALMMSMFFGCSRKVVTVTETKTEVDSSAVERLTKQNTALRETVVRQHKEKQLIQRELATLQKGKLEKDPILPVKEFRVTSGDAYFEAEYQGLINTYSFYLPQRESVEKETSDSTGFFRDLFYSVSDSLADYKGRYFEAISNTHTVETPGWWQRLWNGLKMFWWVIVVVGAVCFVIGWRI